MVRTIIAILILAAAVLWAPLWLQGLLLLIAVLSVRYRIFLLLPAIFADAVYVPTRGFGISMFQVTMVVMVVLLIHFLITTQTRVAELYVPKK